jgi:hypothetical protein
MRGFLLFAVFAGACASDSLIACGDDQTKCAAYGAVCIGGFCHHSDEADLGLDLAILPVEPDLAGACAANGVCTGQTPICDPSSLQCRACGTGECPAPTPICLTTGACAECAAESDCASQKVCWLATHACGPCTANADCGSHVCDAGKCALESDIAHVDNNHAPCAGADGSAMHPYCDIPSAIATGRLYVLVAGSATAYPPLAIGGRSSALTIVGPGRAANPTARIVASGGPAVTLQNVPLKPSPLQIDGLEIVGDAADANHDAVTDVGLDDTVVLSLHDCYVHGSGRSGASSSSAELRIDSSVVADNHGWGVSGGGVKLSVTRSTLRGNHGGVASAGTYTVENNFIVGNVGVGSNGDRAVSFLTVVGSKASGTFRFNTVVNNSTDDPTISAGAHCNDGQTLAASIFIGNTAGSNASQIEGCLLSNVVTGTDAAPSATQLTPSFVSATDFHLAPSAAANTVCCIDKVPSGPTTDFDGSARPKGAGYDIGAHEVE